MNLTKEQLSSIEELSGLFLTPREIAILLSIDIDAFLECLMLHNSPEYLSYMKGKTQSKKEIREKVIKLAKMGSPQAEALAEKYIELQEIAEYE